MLAGAADGKSARVGLYVAAGAGALLVLIAVIGAVVAGASWRLLVDSYTLTNVVIGVSLLASGFLIAWHRPRNAVGPLFLASGFGHLLSAAATMLMVWGAAADWPVGVIRTLSTVATGAWQVGLGLFFPIAVLLFPDGRLPSRRWRPLLWLLVVTGGYQIVTGILSDGSPLGDDPRYTSIISIGLAPPEWINEVMGNGTLIGWLLVIASLVWRYYRGGDRERRQLQWLLLAVVIDLVINTQRVLTADGPILLLLSFVTIPVAIGIAVVRYQLLDIQLVVSRTLLYGLVIAVVIAAYAGIVAALSLVVSAQAERGVSIVAAIVVAIAFNPLRLLMMKLVDRAFYGTRSDPVATASGVGRHLRDEDDLGEVLVQTRSTLRLPWLSLRRTDESVVGTAGVVDSGPAADLPLAFRGRVVGTMRVGLRRGESALHDHDRRTLELIGTPLAAALHAAALREQVQLARTETVEAAAAERVRLQRELHDGLGPVLTSLSFTADAASNVVRSDPDEAERMLADVRSELRGALDGVRRVVYGLRPIELDDLGLVGALRQRVAALNDTQAAGPTVQLHLRDELPPLSAAVELAAYRIVVEALANVTRHSTGRFCKVRITAAEELVLTVDSDGPAPPSWSSGVGLRSMADRAEELGGSVTAGPNGQGWRVQARLPLPSGNAAQD
jgi:two-component system NarL family sensor kinase